ncbi:MAG: hypothetical protein JSR26_06620 [Proteobacteria bacterium]|nr:hypothetical protein [Pseudomonadota bacterium]
MSGMLVACSAHGSSTPLQTRAGLPLPGAGSALDYAGPQGVFDLPNATFDSVVTILDSGEVYGMDLIGGRVAGFFHGTLKAVGTKITSKNLVEYNALDGGYIQVASLSAVFMTPSNSTQSNTDPSLKVSLTFPFGTFDSRSNGQKPYATGESKQIYVRPVAVASLAGSYDGELSTVGTTMKLYNPISTLALSNNGAFTATAQDCKFEGTLTQHRNKGVFDVTAHVTGADCAIAGSMKGLMTPVTLSPTNKTLGFQLLSADARKSAMLYVKTSKP